MSVTIITNKNFEVISGGHATLSDNLISAWELDETTGNAIDVMAVHDLTVTGATQNQSGKIGTAYTFDGNDYLGSIDSTYEITGALTVSSWFKTTETLTNSDGMGIVGNYHYDGNGFRLWLTIDATDTWLKWTIGNQAVSPVLRTEQHYGPTYGGYNVNTGSWFHVVGTFDGTYSKIYVDGALKDTSDAWANNIAYVAANRFVIGSSDVSNHNYWIGGIDAVRIWDRALTADEISDLYTIENGGTGYPWAT